jgi:2,4-dienoyl-CoA reductase-like NADH-dependent reductase (Old Yellow Enzyme family)
MPDLFSPFTLKDVTLRNRIAMSPMTMHRSVDGVMGDYHVMLYGSRAAGGFGLVFPEQIAITPEGRTTIACAGLWDDRHIEGLARVTRIIKEMGGVPAIQLGHTGRKGSEQKPWEGKRQLAARPSRRLAAEGSLPDLLRRPLHLPGRGAERGGDRRDPPGLC